MPRISDIRDGVITLAIFLAIFISLITPLSILTIWLLPLPFFLHAAKNGWASTVIPILLSSLSLLILTGQPFSLGIVFLAAVTGVTMGILYRRSNTTGTDVALGGLTAVWISLLLLFVVASLYFDLQNQVNTLLQEEWKRNGELFRSYGVESADDLSSVFAFVVPGTIFLLALPVSLLSLVTGRRWLNRQGFPGKYLPPFREWRLPRSFFYFYLLSLLLLLIFGDKGNSIILLLANATMVFYTLFFIQGLSLIAWLLHRSGKKKVWMVPITFFSLFPLLGMMVHLMGIVETGSDLRKRIGKKK